MTKRWSFVDQSGTFSLENPHHSSFLYFPLANEAGMMSAITPNLNGDSKTSQKTFFSLPVSAEDLHNTKSGRNFWVTIDGKGAWSAAGASSRQMAGRFTNDEEESVTLEAGFLWHRVTRENKALGIRAEVVSFVPANDDTAELMKVTLTNTGAQAIAITPTTAIPVYGRGAENIRDHRHVTSLLNRVYIVNEGIELQPAMTFDERGHRLNAISYNVYAAEDNGTLPLGAIPAVEEFIGEGGSLEWPLAVVGNTGTLLHAGDTVEGAETIGALRFAPCTLAPGASKAYVVVMSVSQGREDSRLNLKNYLTENCFDKLLNENKRFWEEKLQDISFASSDKTFDAWMKWVTLQPILRRIYGCSFLPHHDYGKGGRGWRDLWQDCLALLLMETDAVRPLLLNNFGGVRMDGTNATIIGSAPGEFIADRNNISRVWSDHGVWPFFTTLLYINQSGDLDFLFERQTYFKDRLAMRCTRPDEQWSPEYGNRQKDEAGKVVSSTVLEHILVQNLTSFFNAGEHNNIRIEGADWNDAFDMAKDRGETVAFTAFYAGNLLALAQLLRDIKRIKGVNTIEVSEELMQLFDSLNETVDYEDAAAKRTLLHRYITACVHNVSGKKVTLDIEQAAQDLAKKGEWLAGHIQKQEWIGSKDGEHWFNGYYDNAARALEGDHEKGVRMTLTGQVFPIMMDIATRQQVAETAKAAKRYLFDESIGGYRLNSNFNEVKLDMGRCFGFAFGTKENGAVFSHMAVMYAFALYKRGFVQEGSEALQSLYTLCSNFEKARIYPGIPEYFNDKGRGLYHYLTGSASWLLLLMLTEVYGVRGALGKLALEPKLTKEQFGGDGKAAVLTVFAGKKLNIVYNNPQARPYGQYAVAGVTMDGKPVPCTITPEGALLEREVLEALAADAVHTVVVELK